MPFTSSPFIAAAPGVRVRIRLTPKAGHTQTGAVALNADGQAFLKVAVTAAPENGKANVAMIRALAKTWRLPRTALAVAAGNTSRNKTVAITGDAADLLPKLERWMETHHD